MTTRSLGQAGPRVSALGLGCMGMSDFYGPADEAESIATIHAALDAGITLLDTGDYYGMGHNELLIREALRGRERDSVVDQRQVRALRDPDGSIVGNDLRPAAVKNFLAYTLRRLGTDYVDIYRPGRVDPGVPIEETVGAIAEMVKAGYVRHVGLSEVGAETIRRAHAVHPISDLQIEYSLLSRGIEDGDPADLPRARHRHHRLRRALARAAQRPLVEGRAARWRRTTSAPLPRASRARTSSTTSRSSRRCATIAEAKGATVAQLAIAWVLSRGEDIVPLVGARRASGSTEALGALDAGAHAPTTSARSRGRSRPARPPASATHAEQMATLDSERGQAPAQRDRERR